METEKVELRNAVIDYAELSTDDHGLLTGWIGLNYGGTGQAFGGYVLYLPESFTHHSLESCAGHWIFRVMQIAGVGNWKDLPGKTIRVKSTWGKVEEIGHIVKDDWFNPAKDFAVLDKG